MLKDRFSNKIEKTIDVGEGNLYSYISLSRQSAGDDKIKLKLLLDDKLTIWYYIKVVNCKNRQAVKKQILKTC